MALKIRLARGGAKKRPFYRIVIADTRSPRDGRFIEKIGSFNPLLPKDNAERIVLDLERAKHWLSVGALPTDRGSRFLNDAGLLKREAPNNPTKAEPTAQAQERPEAARMAAEVAAGAAKPRLSVGALPTDRVARFLNDAGLFKRAARNNPTKAKPKAKAQERLEAARMAAEEAAEAAKAAAEAPAEEAPAEEAQA